MAVDTHTMTIIKDGHSLETALAFHLTVRCFPPVGFMADTCAKAIKLAQEDRGHEFVVLPNGVTYRGAPEATADAIVEGYNLWAFLADPNQYDEYGWPIAYEVIG